METITLGLSFSTRIIGLAVFKSNVLIDYATKLYKQEWSDTKLKAMLEGIAFRLKHYPVSEIVLAMPDKHCQSKDFKTLLPAIITFAHEHTIPVTTYNAKDIYHRFGCPVKRTRHGFMKRLVLLFPELDSYYTKELTNKNKYYIKLFEAVAAGGYHWFENIVL